MNRNTLLWLWLFVLPVWGSAQSSDSLDAIFDDGNLSDPKIILKTAPLNLLHGEGLGMIEVIFSNTFTLNAGVNFQMPFFQRYTLLMFGEPYPSSVKGGFGFRIDPRFYWKVGAGGEGMYLSPVFRQRRYYMEPDDKNGDTDFANMIDYGFGGGTQLWLKKRLTFDVNALLGFRRINFSTNGTRTDRYFNFFLTYTANLGLRF